MGIIIHNITLVNSVNLNALRTPKRKQSTQKKDGDSVMDELQEARRQINRIDRQMAELFAQRMSAVETIGTYKKEHGLPVLDEEREAQVLQKNAVLVEDEELRSYYVSFLRSNMAISRRYQERIQEGMRVSYSGIPGAFAYAAASRIFPRARYESYPDFQTAYDAVADGSCDCAVLPLENSYNGEVSQVIDLMFQGGLFINGMYDLEVTQNLLGLPGAKKEDITTVVSHAQALGQCAEYIRKHGYRKVEAENTALAARYVAEQGKKEIAAIAREETAELYGLEVLEKNINESTTNTTRFGVFSRVENSKKDRHGQQFLLVFTVKNEAGALARAVDIIARAGFNMQTLRSRPMKELLWQYYFYVEADGNIYSEAGERMMRELEECCDRLRVVGHYSAKKERL